MYSNPWGHDYAWERAVVRRIREGGRAPEVYALYDGVISHETGERAGILTGIVFYDEAEAADRAAKNRDFRESLRAAQEAARIRNAQEAEERKARAAEYRAKRAKQKAEHAEQHTKLEKEIRQRREAYEHNRPIEIAEQIEHVNQERQIMASKWICTVCGSKAIIQRKNPGYQITCSSCGKDAWGSHKSLFEVLNR